MNVVFAHPLGTQNSRRAAAALAEAGLLESLVTTLALPPGIVRASWLPERIRRQLARRCYPDVPWEKTCLVPWPELGALSTRVPGFAFLAKAGKMSFSIERHNRAVARRAGRIAERSNARLVYGYEDASLEVFRAARKAGAVTVYDLPIPHWRTLHAILKEERERNPAWADTLEALTASPCFLARKDEELALADHVVVASAISLASVRAVRPDVPTHVIPYGAPLPPFERPIERRRGEPLKIVFVGQLRQRKGISYLFEALRKLAIPFELTLIGPGPSEPSATFRAAVAPHRWLGTMAQADVLDELRRQHVMVFPSLCEGFGLVILEAMGCGVPVITTVNTGGPDVMTDGVDGFIVPIRDADAIADRLTALYEDEPRRQTMATAARATAERWSWERYERAVAATVRAILAEAR